VPRHVYDSGRLTGRTHFVNVMTNQINTGLPVRNDDARYLNADGIFDLRCLVALISETSDLRGAAIPDDPFAATPFCWEDMSLVASIVSSVQLAQRDDIETDPTLAKAVVSDAIDRTHVFVLAARKVYGRPVVSAALYLEYEEAQVKVLRLVRGKDRAEMGEFIFSNIACFSNVALSFKEKELAFDEKFARDDVSSDSSDDEGEPLLSALPPTKTRRLSSANTIDVKLLRRTVRAVSAMSIPEIVAFVPKFKVAHPDRRMSAWDIVTMEVASVDRHAVYKQAQGLKLHKLLLPFDKSRLPIAEYSAWRTRVSERLSRGVREEFDESAARELKSFIDAHEGILDVDGWAMLALNTCPLLRQHGYETTNVTWKVTTLGNQSRKRDL
jgi:hypothetical protein